MYTYLEFVSIVISSQFEYSREVRFENQTADLDFWNNSDSNRVATFFFLCLSIFLFCWLGRNSWGGQGGGGGQGNLLQLKLLYTVCLRGLHGAWNGSRHGEAAANIQYFPATLHQCHSVLLTSRVNVNQFIGITLSLNNERSSFISTEAVPRSEYRQFCLINSYLFHYEF